MRQDGTCLDFGDSSDSALNTELLNDALESGEPGYIKAALGIVARSEGMTKTPCERPPFWH